MSRTIFTLCLLQTEGRLLLGYKKRGFGSGRWNGFGGKLLAQENIDSAARREMLEECGIKPLILEERGILEFHNPDNSAIFEMHIFSVADWEGIATETEEMKPDWFALDDIPYDEMFPDDRFWLPLFLAGKRFKGTFLIRNNSVVISHSLDEITDNL